MSKGSFGHWGLGLFLFLYFPVLKKKKTQSNKYICSRDFPGDAVVKNPPANAGDTGSSPDLGRSHP